METFKRLSDRISVHNRNSYILRLNWEMLFQNKALYLEKLVLCKKPELAMHFCNKSCSEV